MTVGFIFVFIIISGIALSEKSLSKACSGLDGALLACAFLLVGNSKLLHNYILLKAQPSSFISEVFRFFSSSNHFILSLDIIFFFSILMLIIYNILKLEDSCAANK